MNGALLMVGTMSLVGGLGTFVRASADRKGTPLTGTVIGNTERRSRSFTKEYLPTIEYQNPVTGERGIVAPFAARDSRWEIGSSVDLVFFESTGKARYDYKLDPLIPLWIAGIGGEIILIAFI